MVDMAVGDGGGGWNLPLWVKVKYGMGVLNDKPTHSSRERGQIGQATRSLSFLRAEMWPFNLLEPIPNFFVPDAGMACDWLLRYGKVL